MSTTTLANAARSDVSTPAPVDGTKWRAEAAWTVLAGAIVAAFGSMLLVRDPQWFWCDDFQSYQLANYHDVARAYFEGEFPLLTPNSWQCGALAGEYQNGVFSIFLTIINLINFGAGAPLPLAAAILSLAHLSVLSAGTYRLARQNGLAMEFALTAALTTTFSGWIIVWGAKAWFPALAAFAWLPWFVWSLDYGVAKSDDGRPRSLMRFVPTAVFLYLILTAGWPFTVLMAGLWTAWRLAKYRVEQQAWLPTWPILVGCAVGFALAAPALWMLVEYTSETVRGQTRTSHWTDHWIVPIGALPGFLFPGYTATWNVFGLEKPHHNIELAGGLVPLAGILCALFVGGVSFVRKFAWEIALCVCVLGLAMIPSPGNFRWSFRWLPMVALLLSLVGAQALQQVRAAAESKRPSVGFWATLLVTLVWLPAWLVGHASDFKILWQGMAFTLVGAGWCLVEWRTPNASGLSRWTPAAVAIVLAGITFVPVDTSMEVIAWNPAEMNRALPLDRGTRYLSVHVWSDLFAASETGQERKYSASGKAILPGNYNQYAGVEFINGYSPMQPVGMTKLFAFGTHGYIGGPSPDADPKHIRSIVRFIRNESGPDDLLALMGVNGLIVSDTFSDIVPALEQNGWQRQAPIAGATLLHRAEPKKAAAQAIKLAARTDNSMQMFDLIENRKLFDAPWVLFSHGTGETFDDATPAQEYADARVEVVSESRHRVVAEVRNPTTDRETLVLFSRPIFPGYTATFNGKPVSIERFQAILPAVRLPHGESGTVVLEYRPNSLQRGSQLAMCAILGVGLIGLLDVSRRRRIGAAS